MRKTVRPIMLAMILIMWGATSCFGSGYGIYEWSARGNALGGTLIGRADDPSAVAYNPAGITQLPGLQMMAGMTAIAPNTDVKVKNPYTQQSKTFDGEKNIWTIPHFYTTKQLNDSYWFGFGLYTRAGLGTEYKNGDDWWGRYNCSYVGIKEVGFNPNLAMKLTDKLSFAFGMEVAWLDFTYKKSIDSGAVLAKLAQQNPALAPLVPKDLNNPENTSRDIKSTISGDAWGYGFNMALHYKPTDWMAMGLTYRSKISFTVNGEADFDSNRADSYLNNLDLKVPGLGTGIKQYLGDTDAKGTAPAPEMISAGIMFKPIEPLSLEFDVIYTRWSAYDELTIEFDSSLEPSENIKDWKDTWRFQFGVEYALLDWMDLRAGYTYDQSPVQDDHVDYMVPANNRHLYSLGTGFHWDNWVVDLSYTYLTIEKRDVDARPADGVYESEFDNGHSHLVGLSVGYKF